MEVRIAELEKSIKRTSLTSNLISIFLAVVTALGVGFGFYYTTKSRLSTHDTQIQEIQETVKETENKVNDLKVYKGVSSTEMKNLNEKVDKIDEKLDKLILLQTKD